MYNSVCDLKKIFKRVYAVVCEFVSLCETLLLAIWEKVEEEEEFADRTVCHPFPSALQKQTSLSYL